MHRNTIVFGANGGIGRALCRLYAQQDTKVWALSRTGTDIENVENLTRDPYDQEDLANVFSMITSVASIQRIIVASGCLMNTAQTAPEKSLRHQSTERFQHLFAANTILPALIAKHALTKMPRDQRTEFAVLSARVGSITDNRLGGWHAYRASKAALNMLIKTYAIEMARTHPQHLCVGLHPGTVDTQLSRPFQSNVPPGTLFTPDHAANCLRHTLEHATPEQSGQILDWSGKIIPP
ncbi:MAG: SDR family NAD(P)-dependent oxidoreductase [Pelagimonas sp.]|jgi:NAD(P)-dependent dehydrogenase (short-subunit alcohol dehydrogenase family)|nr:SDR family NAD(P)-dependent oxidoreductase [Pelagimonas sp.]